MRLISGLCVDPFELKASYGRVGPMGSVHGSKYFHATVLPLTMNIIDTYRKIRCKVENIMIDYDSDFGPVRLSYFSVMEQCFSLVTFHHKHRHKPNFSISEHDLYLLSPLKYNIH